MNSIEVRSPEEHAQQLRKIDIYYTKAQRFYKRVWDKHGLHYGLWTPEVRSRKVAVENENQVLSQRADVKPGDWVLDAGCGIGGSGIWLAHHKGAHIVEANIVDLQLREGVKEAQKSGTASLQHFNKVDYHTLPYRDKSFDVVWSLESIEHSDDVPKFLSEANRVLKPGGRLVIAGTFRGEVEPTEKQKYQLYIGQRVAGVFNNFRSAAEVTEVVQNLGFLKIANTDETQLVMPSSTQMDNMCKGGLPGARFGHRLGVISQEMVDNTAWGTYQKGLFKSGVTSYNIISATKPSSSDK